MALIEAIEVIKGNKTASRTTHTTTRARSKTEDGGALVRFQTALNDHFFRVFYGLIAYP